MMAERPASGLLGRGGLLLVAALVAGCVVAGVIFFTSPLAEKPAPVEPTPTSPPPVFEVPAEPVTGSVGDNLTWNQYNGRGTVTVHGVRWETEGNQPPTPDNRYLVLDVEIIATEGLLSVNPLYLSAYDAEGTESLLDAMAGYQPEIEELALQPGPAVRAFATFDIRPGQTTVVFTDELFNPTLEISVPGPG